MTKALNDERIDSAEVEVMIVVASDVDDGFIVDVTYREKGAAGESQP